MRRWVLGPGVGACVLAGAAAHAADTDGASGSPGDDFLTWSAPPGCGAAATIRERVGDLLGERELALERIKRVEGRVRESRDGWALTLRLFDASGVRERELSSRDCNDLPEAAAVAITLAFEAARAQAAATRASGAEGATSAAPPGTDTSNIAPDTAPDTGPGADPSPEVGAAESARSVSAAGESTSPATRFSLGAEAIVDGSALPAAAAGISVLGAVRWDELRLGAFAAWLPGAQQKVGPNQGADFALLVLGLRGCYALGHGLIDTALCAGLEAGQLSAQGSGLARARTAHDLWMAPQLGLELSAEPAPGWTLRVHAEALAPLFRQGYAVNDTEDIHHVSGLGARAGIGILVDL